MEVKCSKGMGRRCSCTGQSQAGVQCEVAVANSGKDEAYNCGGTFLTVRDESMKTAEHTHDAT